MSDVIDNKNYQFELLRELATRSKHAGFVYLVLFAVIGFAPGGFSESPVSFSVGSVLFLVAAMARVIVGNKLSFENQRIWKVTYFLAVLATSFMWGAFAFYSIYDLGIRTLSLLIIFATGGIAGGSSSSLGISLPLHRIHLSLILIPTMVALAISPAPGAMSMAIMVTLFFAALFAQAKIVFNDLSSVIKKTVVIEQQNKQLQEANEKAFRATEAKSLFLANMSHEIRTPMNGILSCTNFLQDRVNDPQGMEFLDTIQNCGDSLLVIINDILDFSKIESGKIELENEPFDLSGSVKGVVGIMNGKASENGVVISSRRDESVPSWVKGDITRFRQVLTNLVSNAIKFTKDKVEVVTSLKSVNGSVHEIEFSVTDNGIGIPEEARHRLFQDFSQVDASTTRRFGGTGLGLAISKGITEAMGGKIWVESKVNHGSTFHFTIKVEATEAIDEQTEKAQHKINAEMGEEHPLKILVAEDNSVNQMVAKTLLSKLGYQADLVDNGLEAVEAVKNQDYDVILMDQHMPEMDGIEATKEIIQFAPSKLKIIALTASAFKEDRDRCLEAGMHGFMSKPIQLQELVQALKQVEPNRNLEVVEETSPLVDEGKLQEQFEGMSEILDDIIAEALASIPNYLDSIGHALKTEDAKSLEVNAHTLKGVVANFHAQGVVETAEKLEQMGRKQDLAGAPELYKRLEVQVEQLQAELKSSMKGRMSA